MKPIDLSRLNNHLDFGYFNQNISSWNVSAVTNMNEMFEVATSFNQDLSTWDVSNVTNFDGMFRNASSLSDENKCAIHTSWSTNSSWPYGWNELCAPTILVAPTSISDALFSGETSTHTLTITNSGGNRKLRTCTIFWQCQYSI